jgi:hypothetical protein
MGLRAEERTVANLFELNNQTQNNSTHSPPVVKAFCDAVFP